MDTVIVFSYIYIYAVIKHNKPPIICFAQLHFISEFCRISLKTRHRHRIYSDWLSSLPSSSSREGGGLRCAYRNSIGHPLIKILPWLWHCETINKKIKSRKYHVWTSDLHVHPNSRFITWKEGGGVKWQSTVTQQAITYKRQFSSIYSHYWIFPLGTYQIYLYIYVLPHVKITTLKTIEFILNKTI